MEIEQYTDEDLGVFIADEECMKMEQMIKGVGYCLLTIAICVPIIAVCSLLL